MKVLTPWLIIAILLMGGGMTVLYKQNVKLKETIVILKYESSEKVKDAEAQCLKILQENQTVLETTIADYEKSKSVEKAKMDEILQQHNISMNQLVSATLATTAYKDTNRVVATQNQPYFNEKKQGTIKQLQQKYTVPVSFADKCWGMKGEIITTDPEATLEITERVSNTNVLQVITKEKRFLFIRIKPARYQVFSDCGEVLQTTIKFVKQ